MTQTATRKQYLDVLVRQWERAGVALLEQARNTPPYEFAPDECPLKDERDCRSTSEELFGTGCFMWTCGFCGSKWEE